MARISSSIFATSVGFKPASTSSSSSSLGLAARARATSSRFLSAMVRCLRQQVGAIRHVHLVQHLQRRPRAPRAGPDTPAKAAANRDIVQCRHLVQWLHDLVSACHPRVHQFVRRPSRDVLSGKRKRPAVVGIYAVDNVEQRGLARAVRADESENLALVQGEADVGDRQQPAEPFRDSLPSSRAVIRSPSVSAAPANTTSRSARPAQTE